jgi:RNA polymerase sigma factor (sigma-70 family)
MNDTIGELYEELRGYLVTIIRNRLYTGCPDDYIYDCLNDVFEIALTKQSDPNFQQNPRGWLIVTTKNTADNFNRKALGRLSYHQSDCKMDWIPSQKDMLENLSYQLAVEGNIVERVKHALSPEDCQLFVMRYEQKLNPQEISEKLQISLGASHTRLTRMKQRAIHLIHAYVN